MDKLAYTALAGILQHGQERTRLSHQMANVTTPGFKKSSGGTTTFQKVVGDGVFDTRYQPVAATKNPVVLISPGPVNVECNGKSMFAVLLVNSRTSGE